MTHGIEMNIVNPCFKNIAEEILDLIIIVVVTIFALSELLYNSGAYVSKPLYQVVPYFLFHMEYSFLISMQSSTI